VAEKNRENSADLLNKKYQFQVKLNGFLSENKSKLMVFGAQGQRQSGVQALGSIQARSTPDDVCGLATEGQGRVSAGDDSQTWTGCRAGVLRWAGPLGNRRERQAGNARDEPQALASARPRADGLRAQAPVAVCFFFFFLILAIGSGTCHS
jgi:hypothetical protein